MGGIFGQAAVRHCQRPAFGRRGAGEGGEESGVAALVIGDAERVEGVDGPALPCEKTGESGGEGGLALTLPE